MNHLDIRQDTAHSYFLLHISPQLSHIRRSDKLVYVTSAYEHMICHGTAPNAGPSFPLGIVMLFTSADCLLTGKPHLSH